MSTLQYQSRTEWSDTLGLRIPLLKDQLQNPIESIRIGRNLSTEGQLLQHWGSRTLPWRLYLGLLDTYIPETYDGDIYSDNLNLKVQWVRQTKAYRQQFAAL